MEIRTRKGELSACASAVLSGTFPVLTTATVATLQPLYAATVATAISSVFFACVLTARGRWKELGAVAAWKDMIGTTLCIAIGYYGLLFTGFRYTTPGNGAVIGLLQVLFTFVIVNALWRHERFSPRHAAGAACMVLGALCILLPQWSGKPNPGNLLIILATMIAPVGNVYAQRARRLVSAETIMFARSGIGCMFLFCLALSLEPLPNPNDFLGVWWQLLLNGIVVLGFSKILWIEAIHRLPIAQTISITMMGILVTFLLTYVFLRQAVTVAQLASIPPMIAGLWLLMKTSAAKQC